MLVCRVIPFIGKSESFQKSNLRMLKLLCHPHFARASRNDSSLILPLVIHIPVIAAEYPNTHPH